MKRLIRKQITDAELGNNPLVAANFRIRYRTIKSNISLVNVKDVQEGIVTAAADNISNEYIVEDYKPTKVYTETALRLHIGAMSSKSRDLYLWLIYEAESSKDYIWINYERYMIEFGVSYNTYKEALKELILNNILQLTVYSNHNYYWTNPLFFFNGNRLNKYPDHIIER